MENKEGDEKREMFLTDDAVSIVNCSFLLSLKDLLNNAVLPLKPACQSVLICHGKKGMLTVLAVGFVEKKRRRDSCISVASLPHGKYLFILTRSIFIALPFKRYLH